MSPNLGDVDFFPGGVRTRPGLVSQFPLLGGAPQINGLKTYITTNLVQRLLVFDALGNLYKETSPGVLSVVVPGAAKPNLYLASTTLFGREYMAFGDGVTGQDLPRQYDDVNYDRVSQIGPAEGPARRRRDLRAAFRPACISAWWCSSRARDSGPRLRRQFPGPPRAV